MAKKNSPQNLFWFLFLSKEKKQSVNNYNASQIQQLNSIKLNTVNPLQILLIWSCFNWIIDVKKTCFFKSIFTWLFLHKKIDIRVNNFFILAAFSAIIYFQRNSWFFYEKFHVQKTDFFQVHWHCNFADDPEFWVIGCGIPEPKPTWTGTAWTYSQNST